MYQPEDTLGAAKKYWLKTVRQYINMHHGKVRARIRG